MRVLKNGVPIPIRELLLDRAKRAVKIPSGYDLEFEKKYPGFIASRYFRYFMELGKTNVTIGASNGEEARHITMMRIALDRRAPVGERFAAADAFFKVARKHNITAEQIVSITHPLPPPPKPVDVAPPKPVRADPPKQKCKPAPKKDWCDSVWGNIVGWIILIPLIFLVGVVMIPVHTMVAPGVIETHFSWEGGVMPFALFAFFALFQVIGFALIYPFFWLFWLITGKSRS
jgi:hypothetical protein